jgi:hypothetical protein
MTTVTASREPLESPPVTRLSTRPTEPAPSPIRNADSRQRGFPAPEVVRTDDKGTTTTDEWERFT